MLMMAFCSVSDPYLVFLDQKMKKRQQFLIKNHHKISKNFQDRGVWIRIRFQISEMFDPDPASVNGVNMQMYVSRFTYSMSGSGKDPARPPLCTGA